ncbi:hypothetical protein NW752_004215 [Fusarium irregulare]|uniref:Uncharacterized protein n=1 Tax=Fusarium irregulare TaxID=2494466 RepID=A0A9W8U9C7_9HYPO|nr:hypothetical protein NW766_007113 [Fusarium irregulare]KAJ4021208.1 hypothetical protein NW752_004215 [Fusarium irregulare]
MQLMHSNINNGQAILHLTYNNFILLLHRPAPRPHAGDSAVESCADPVVCGDAIAEIGSIFDTLFKEQTLSSMWFYGNHVLFTARIYAMNEFSSNKPLIAVKSRRLLGILIGSLRGLSEYWRFAQSLLQVFEERLARLESCNSARTTISFPAPQSAEDLGQKSREASGSESSLDYTLLREHGVEANSVWNNVEDQISGNVNTEVANDQSSNPTTILNSVTSGLIPETNGDAILNGFALLDDFTLELFLNESDEDEGNFV